MSLQVDGDDLVVLREHGKNRSEHLARPKPTVQQDQRAPSPMRFVIELDAVDLGVLAGALRVGRPIGLHCCAPFCARWKLRCRTYRLRWWLEFIGAAVPADKAGKRRPDSNRRPAVYKSGSN